VLSTIVVDRPLADALPARVSQTSVPGFEVFYLANERRLFRALYVMTGDRDEAEDVMQTAFCKVWERWDKVAGLDDPVGYLFRTAFNTHRSAVRRSVRAARRLVGRHDPTPPPEPSEVATAKDDASRALDVLTRRQREAVVLTAMLGLGGPEAAQVMGISPATVRALISQARAALARTADGGDPNGTRTK
jgi:RNA polymerase sigma-70 factor (ECF subfamily)